MTEERDGAPPSPEKLKMEVEEEPDKQLLNNDHHSEDESKDELSSERNQSPPLLSFPLVSTLPPTPPLPCSPTDLEMEDQDSENDGPPPGWDNSYQLKQQTELLSTPAVISSDVKADDVKQDVCDEDDPKPQLQTHPTPAPELVPSDIKLEDRWQDAQNKEGRPQSSTQELISLDHEKTDIKVEQQDSEDEGPPPGWDSKFQPEPERQTTCSTTPISDIKTKNVQEGAQNKDGPQQQSDMKVEEQDSEDEGPPPGWDSKCESEPNLQTAHPTTSQSDIKTEDIQQNARNEDCPQPHSQAHPSAAPELAPSDMKVEEQDSEDDGPPPGWGSKCQPESELKPEPEPQSESTPKLIVTGSTISPSVQKDVKIVEEIVQPSTRQQSLPPTKRKISVPKPPTSIDYPEMGQMVCGSCRHLLSYPRGARYVECACCLEENYVLEEHEVGQVICGGCNVLLMYPYGAPKVRCANCSIETEIGDQNRRPTLSEHQSRARRHLKRVHVG